MYRHMIERLAGRVLYASCWLRAPIDTEMHDPGMSNTGMSNPGMSNPGMDRH